MGLGSVGVLGRGQSDVFDVGVVVSNHIGLTWSQSRKREGGDVAGNGAGRAISHSGVSGKAKAEHGGDGGENCDDLLLHNRDSSLNKTDIFAVCRSGFPLRP